MLPLLVYTMFLYLMLIVSAAGHFKATSYQAVELQSDPDVRPAEDAILQLQDPRPKNNLQTSDIHSQKITNPWDRSQLLSDEAFSSLQKTPDPSTKRRRQKAQFTPTRLQPIPEYRHLTNFPIPPLPPEIKQFYINREKEKLRLFFYDMKEYWDSRRPSEFPKSPQRSLQLDLHAEPIAPAEPVAPPAIIDASHPAPLLSPSSPHKTNAVDVHKEAQMPSSLAANSRNCFDLFNICGKIKRLSRHSSRRVRH